MFAALLIGCGLLACGGPEPPPGVSTERAELVSELGQVRLSEARWTGGFAHATYEPASHRPPLTAEARELGQKINRETLDTPRAVSDWAFAKLIEGKVEEAAAAMERYGKEKPVDGPFLTDFSAVLVERSRKLRQPEDLIHALTAAEKAVQAAPTLPEARFNLALVLGLLGLEEDAEKAWDEYLKIDTASDWSHEAREHLTALNREPQNRAWAERKESLKKAALLGQRDVVKSDVERFPQSARLYTESMLNAWAEAQGDGDEAEARRSLDVARALAAALAEVTGDPLLGQSIAAIDRAAASPTREQWNALLRGHQEHAAGMKSIANPGEAAVQFRSAEKLLGAQGSPFVAWSRFYLAVCEYQWNDYSRATVLLTDLLRDLRATPFHAVQARAWSMLGLIHIIEGRPEPSRSASEQALAGFEALGETGYAAGMHSQIANSLHYVGEQREAWNHRYQALVKAQEAGSPGVRYVVFEELAIAARQLGELSVALRFQEEVVRSARILKVPSTVAEALRNRAELHRLCSDNARALSDLSETEQVSSQITDEQIRRAILGNVFLVRGEMEREDAPRRALELLDQAIETIRDTEYHYLLARGLVERGLVHAALQDTDKAEADFAAAAEECERQRNEVEPAHRASYLDTQQAVFQENVLFQIDHRQDSDRAFHYAERRRARVLLDWLLSSSLEDGSRDLSQAAPLPVDKVLAEMPRDVLLVEYVLARGRLFAWVLGNGQAVFQEIHLPGDPLVSWVERLGEGIGEKNASETRAAASALYERLIRPLVAHLPKGRTLVFVPDGPLHSVPFAALFDDRKGRYLVEDHPIGMAPSATVYVKSAAREKELAGKATGSMLVFGDPAFDGDLFPGLPRLSGAGQELARMKSLFPQAQGFTGADATKRAFLQASGEYEIVHFGGHAVPNDKAPLLSRLLFAPEPDDPSRGVLYGHELLGRRFPGTRLVVLAACRSGSGRFSASEGAESLAQPFLATGVPVVVASLWDVKDEVGARFFGLFYERLKAGDGAMTALRVAQIKVLRQKDSDPYQWAGFIVAGGALR